MKISIIITTYNRLSALQAVIRSLLEQDYAGEIEIVVADDGSTTDTTDWLQQQKTHTPIVHVWQPDDGFRAAQIRNRAAAKASGDYFIFIDGDCIAPSHFLQHHAKLSEPEYFVSGNRILLSATFTEQVLAQHLPIHTWKYKNWLLARLQGKCNRALPFLPLFHWLLPAQRSQKWEGAKTCNLALWRKDFMAVNGFDERYQGWGYEDSDLVIRLIRAGVQRKNSRFSIPVLHLWHRENDRSHETPNRSFLQSTLESDEIITPTGVNQYFP